MSKNGWFRNAVSRLLCTGKKQQSLAAALVAALPWAVALSLGRQAEANYPTIWQVYPGLNKVKLWEYGWHFDETAGQFGAKDYNASGDEGAETAFWAKIVGLDSKYSIRFRLEHRYDCGVKVIPEYYDGYAVHEITGAEFHYTHLTNRPPSPSYTPWGWEAGYTFLHAVGNLATCGTPATHLHQSADLEQQSGKDGEVSRIGQLNDTCWSNVDTFHCPSTYRVHDPNSECPPGAAIPGATGGISGNVAQYVCEEWSLEYRDPKSPAFEVHWWSP